MSHSSARVKRATALLAASAVVATSGVLAVVGGQPAQAAVDSGVQLVTNGSFEKGLTGWRSNSTSTQKLWRSPGVGYAGAASAKLTRAGGATGNLVLNDIPNTVISVPARGTYAATVAVRTLDPNMSGQLRVREVRGATVTAHKSSFDLAGTGWTTVDLTFTAAKGAALDLNVIFWKAAPGESAYVDAVSLVRVPDAAVTPTPTPTTSPTPTPTPTTSPTPSPTPSPTVTPTPDGGRLTNGCAYSSRGIPECGVLFGAAVGSNTDPTAFEREVGGNLGVRRTYWGAANSNNSITVANNDTAAGRIPWVSYKLPYSWPEMAAGKGDAWAIDLIKKLGEVDGPVWIAFHHEPENDADIKDWVAMQRHLAPLVHTYSENVAMTIVVTGWHQLYGEAQFSLENIWPGDGLVDLIGFDIYNQYGVVKNGTTNLKGTDFAASYYPQISAFAKKHGVAWGLGETGFTDRAAQDDPQWLARTYEQTARWGGSAIAYFNTSLNSAGSWVITSQSKTALFRDVLKSSPSLR